MPRFALSLPSAFLSPTFFSVKRPHGDLSEFEQIWRPTMPLRVRESVPLASILVELPAQAITLRKGVLNQRFMEGLTCGPQDGIVS